MMPLSALAEDAAFPGTFSASITGVTDYRFRGVSQTQEKPTIQAGADYAHPSGFKVGVWGSGVDFNTPGDGVVETDIFGLYAWELAPFTMETGIYYYAYPGVSSNLKYNYGEAYGSVSYSYDIVTLAGCFFYTPQNFGDSGSGYYPQLSASVALPYDVTLDGAVGRQWIGKNAIFGLPDYTTWNAGIAYTYEGFTGKLQYVDTSISELHCAAGCDATVVVSITKAF